MMSHTNVDYLFQLTAPSSDRGPGTALFGEDRPAFNDHLAQAADTSRDTPSKVDPKPTAIEYPRPDEHRRLAIQSTSQEHDEPEAPDCVTCGEPEAPTSDADAESDSLEEPVGMADGGVSESDPAASESKEGGSSADDDASEVSQAAAISPEAARREVTSAAAALPDAILTELTGEASLHKAAGSPHATNDELNESLGEPNDEAAAELPAKPAAVATVAANRDAKLNAAQKANQADAIAGVATVTASPLVQEPHGGTADAKESDELRQSKETEHNAPDNKRPVRTETATSDLPKAGLGRRVKPEKLSAGRRASETTKPDESRRGAGSPVESRSESTASASKAVAAAIANQIAALPAAATTGNQAAEEGPATTKLSGTGDALIQAAGRANRGAGATGGSRRTGAAESMPRIDGARFVGRVAKAVQTAHERGGALQLRLSPPELGSLRLELNVQNGVMTAALETENPAARQVLLDHLPALRERLAEQNIRIERFDVDVRQEGSGGQTDPRESQHHERQRQPHAPAPRPALNRTQHNDAGHHAPAPRYPGQNSSGINVLA